MKKPTTQWLLLTFMLLVLTNLLREALFYSSFGISVIRYTTLTSLLLNPIDYIVTHPIMLAAFAGIFYYYVVHSFAGPERQPSQQFDIAQLTREEQQPSPHRHKDPVPAVLFAVLLLGAGFYEGLKEKQRHEEGILDYKDQIVFISQGARQVEVIGQNHAYLFCLERRASTPIVIPINGVVREIRVER
jgi:hypothetical protein